MRSAGTRNLYLLAPDGMAAAQQWLVRTWHPAQPAERASHVEVTFAAVAAQTPVRVEHAGWDALDDPAAARAEYDHGWPHVLDRYAEHMSAGGEDDTWVALLHRPGPAATS